MVTETSSVRPQQRNGPTAAPSPSAGTRGRGVLKMPPQTAATEAMSDPSTDTNRGSGVMSESCPACARDKRRKLNLDLLKEDWVACDQCGVWFHWRCVAVNPLDPIDIIDKWYCTDCLSSNPKLTITFRPPPRQSSRKRQSINYANLDSGLAADPEKWVKVLEKKTILENKFRKFKDGNELGCDDWLWGGAGDAGDAEESMMEPIIIESPEGLGMKMPSNDITVTEVARIVGVNTPVEVIDVASQSDLSHWTLGKWATYYSDPRRDKVRNVISLEVTETELGKKIVPPEVVRRLDWVDTIWPKDKKLPGMYPKVGKYCLMSVEKCWTDWHIDFAGSSVFYHILKGAKVFYFIRPTPDNLKKYEKWSSSAEKQENVWLGDEVDEVYKVELTAGNTMMIPTGWIHAVYTPSDSLVFGGNFLHSLNIATQLRIVEIEIATRVPRKFRFPFFGRMCWYVAHHYHQRLSKILSSTKKPRFPKDINRRVLQGLKSLSTYLLSLSRRISKTSSATPEQRKAAKESVPNDLVDDPKSLAKQFGKLVREALGEDGKGWLVDVDSDAETKSRSATPVRAGSADKGGATSVKRKRANGDLPVANGANRFKNLGPVAGKSDKNGGGPEEFIVEKTTLAPSTRIERQLRKRPRPRNEAKAENGDGEEEGADEVDVHITESEIRVVRRIESRDGSGRVVMETRVSKTIIERVVWDPLAQPPLPIDTSTPGGGDRMNVDKGEDLGAVKTEEGTEEIPAKVNGTVKVEEEGKMNPNGAVETEPPPPHSMTSTTDIDDALHALISASLPPPTQTKLDDFVVVTSLPDVVMNVEGADEGGTGVVEDVARDEATSAYPTTEVSHPPVTSSTEAVPVNSSALPELDRLEAKIAALTRRVEEQHCVQSLNRGSGTGPLSNERLDSRDGSKQPGELAKSLVMEAMGDSDVDPSMREEARRAIMEALGETDEMVVDDQEGVGV